MNAYTNFQIYKLNKGGEDLNWAHFYMDYKPYTVKLKNNYVDAFLMRDWLTLKSANTHEKGGQNASS